MESTGHWLTPEPKSSEHGQGNTWASWGKQLANSSPDLLSWKLWGCDPAVRLSASPSEIQCTTWTHYGPKLSLPWSKGYACQFPAICNVPSAQSSLRLTSIESVMPSSHLILCRPLLLLPPIPPSIRVFSNESTLRLRWPKYWSFTQAWKPSSQHAGAPGRPGTPSRPRRGIASPVAIRRGEGAQRKRCRDLRWSPQGNQACRGTFGVP